MKKSCAWFMNIMRMSMRITKPVVIKPCKKAEQSIKEKIVAVGITSLIYGWVTNDLRSSSLLNTFWQISKYLLKNDKETQREFGIVIACKLGFEG